MFDNTRMHGSVNTRKGRNKPWRYYACARKKFRPKDCPASKYVSAERLEKATLSVLYSKVLTPDFVEQLAGQVNAILSDETGFEAELTALRKRDQKLEKAIKNLLDLAETDPASSLLDRLRQREAEHAAIRRDIERLETQARQTSLQIDEG